MRDYGVVSPRFWIGETGKQMRGNPNAQIVALYLMTSPHANMIGVFHCPLLYISHETGLPFEGASEGLRSLVEAGFCTYDEATETIFVHRMAAFQISESLKAADNRVKSVTREWDAIAVSSMKSAFYDLYAEAFHLPKPEQKRKGRARGLEDPSKPRTGTGTGPVVDDASQALPAKPAAGRGSRLPPNWELPEQWRIWAAAERPDLDPSKTAERFRDHWLAKAGRDGCKLDWLATWRNWVRNERSMLPAPAGVPAQADFAGVL